MLCTAPGRLGRVERGRGIKCGRDSLSRRGEEKDAPPYVPNWLRVTVESNLATADEKMEWLLNCLPSNVLEGYNTFGVGCVIGLGVHSVVLVSVLCQTELWTKRWKREN